MYHKSVSAVVGIVLALSPVFAAADALSDLQAQIQALMAQIAALKAAGAGGNAVAASSSSCVNLTHNMSAGDRDVDTGGDVSRLQKFLTEDSAIYPEGRVTGYFGPATERAVKRWQKARGIASSGDPDSTGYGYVGPKTRAAMSCAHAGAPSSQGTVTYATDVAMERHAEKIIFLPHCGNDNDFYDGGDGTDTVTYSGKRSDFHITKHADGSYTFKDLVSCRADTDTVINIEVFVFADGTRTLDTLYPDHVELAMPVSQPDSSLPSPVITLRANPSTIGAVRFSELSWSAMYANRCVLQYGSTEESVNTSDSRMVSPSQTTNYRLICTNDPGNGKDGPSAEKTITVGVNVPTCTLRSDKQVYQFNELVTISWWTENATYTMFPPDTSGKDNIFRPTGEKGDTNGYYTTTANIYGNPYVDLNVYNYYGQGSCSLTISVPQP